MDLDTVYLKKEPQHSKTVERLFSFLQGQVTPLRHHVHLGGGKEVRPAPAHEERTETKTLRWTMVSYSLLCPVFLSSNRDDILGFQTMSQT